MKKGDWQSRVAAWCKAPVFSASPSRHYLLHDDRLVSLALGRLLAKHPKGPVLAVFADSAAAESAAAAFSAFQELLCEHRPVIPLPEVAIGRRQWLPENEGSRCAALEDARAGTPALYVATAATLLAETLAPRKFSQQSFTLAVGQTLAINELTEKLVAMDYDHEFEAAMPGEFAVRGGIVDIFSPLYADPVRIEFWGDEIDSMRYYSADTQRSKEPLKQMKVIPRGAAVIAAKDTETAPAWEYFPKDIPVIVCNEEAILRHLSQYQGEDAVEKFNGYAGAYPSLIRLDAPPLADAQRPGGVANSIQEALATTAEQAGEVVRIDSDILSLSEELTSALPELDGEGGVALWHWRQLKTQLVRWHGDGYQMAACCGSDGEIERLEELLHEDEEIRQIPVIVEKRDLPQGVILPNERLVLLSDQEIFGRRSVRRCRRRIEYNYSQSEEPNELLELTDGAYAVHVNYGICKYHGIHMKEIDGEKIEAIELEFADDQRLYVPVDQSFLVARYIGGTKNTPNLSDLGGHRWDATKKKAQEAAWDLAAELIRLEAMRAASPGFKFKESTEWERAFAGSFPYDLTPDQEAAVQACYADMASEKPMDRLLCGDVGYGKTEVALRAAFRAVMNGKQVALLVPTTVLAQQHYQTFVNRLKEFPVRVEMLSRFRSASTQRRVIEGLALGEIDIVVGTHRLVSKDVTFANLGLLIIDEEQRFGVKHKQRLKAMRANLDILTMTATPIPRTLYLSLSGLRNLSTIMTAPQNRLPVTTVVANYDDELIRLAILREIERHGQVFYLHNRVNTIGYIGEKIQRLVPDARVAVAHGQMTSEQLEKVMTAFVAGRYDVLVSTTIVESGIDIPNANTMIIDRADRFGLSELYQLRGRVGRDYRQAYAYMLLPPMGELPANARERLAAIKRFTHLGAGFRLAMKDLEIRGAGNILGQEQSGHIAAVGFDLYCRLLKSAVARLHQQEPLHRRRTIVELQMTTTSMTPVKGKIQATILPEFIADEQTRLMVYRRLQELNSIEEVVQYGNELQDRFGALPESMKNLLQLTRITIVAQKRGVIRLATVGDRLVIETDMGIYRHPATHQVPMLLSSSPKARMAEVETLLNTF